MNNGSDSPLSLASLMTAKPEDIKKLMSSLPPQLLANVRAAFATPGDTVVVETTHDAQPAPPAPPAPFPVEPVVTEPTPVIQPVAPVAPVTAAPKIMVPEFAFKPPATFESLAADFPLYDPMRGNGRSILGVLLTSIELPKQTSAGRALIIRAIEPTIVVDNTGRSFECKIGQDILLEASHWLRALVRRAHDPDNVGEVWLRPGERRLCDGGDYIFDWQIFHGRLFPRSQFQKAA